MHPFTIPVDTISGKQIPLSGPSIHQSGRHHSYTWISTFSTPAESGHHDLEAEAVTSFRRNLRPIYWVALIYGLNLDGSRVYYSPIRSLLSTLLQVVMILVYLYTVAVAIGTLIEMARQQQSIFRPCDDICSLMFALCAFFIHLILFWKRDILCRLFEATIQAGARIQTMSNEEGAAKLQETVRAQSLRCSAIPWLGSLLLLSLRLMANWYQCSKLGDPAACDLLQPQQCHQSDNTTMPDPYEAWFQEFNFQKQIPFPQLPYLVRDSPFGSLSSTHKVLTPAIVSRLDLFLPQMILMPFYLLGASIFLFGCHFLGAVMAALADVRSDAKGHAAIQRQLSCHRDVCQLVHLMDTAYGLATLVWCTLEIACVIYVVRGLNLHQPYIFNAQLLMPFMLHVALFFAKVIAADSVNCHVMDSLTELRESINEPLALNHMEATSLKTDVGLYVQQLVASPPALTGWDLFTLDKGLTLSVSGAVITYALVLYGS